MLKHHSFMGLPEENDFDFPQDKLTVTEEFSKITEELETLFKAKNSDYGSAVDITYLMFGETAQLVRLWDKLLRITQITLSGSSLVKEESLNDTLRDLANYSMIALAQRRVFGNVDKTQALGRAVESFITDAEAKRKQGGKI